MNHSELLTALNIVEEDHQLVLHKMQALREALGEWLEPGGEALPRALRRLRELYSFFASKFESHMEEEEAALLPLLERGAPGGVELAARLREEHMEIRRRCAAFGDSLAYAAQLDDELPRAVLRDLLRFGWEFWAYLDQHAHAETDAVRKAVAGALDPQGAAADA